MNNLKLLCQKNNNSYDITKIVDSIKWSGNINTCSRQLEFNALNSFDIPLSSLIIFFENDKELFRGFVFERDKTSDNELVKYLCYDYGEKLNKIKVSYNFKNKTPSEIINIGLKDYGFNSNIKPLGNEIKINKIFMNTSLFEVFQTAYTIQSKSDGEKYMIFADKDKISSVKKGKKVLDIALEEGKNIINSNFKESISNIVNKVIIIDEKGNKKGEVQNDELLKTHGLFQEVYKMEEGKNSINEAKSLLKDVEKTCSLSGIGDTTCQTGYGVYVKDRATGLVGLFFIDSDTHTFKGGEYTIDLTLNFQNFMHEVEAGEDEKNE